MSESSEAVSGGTSASAAVLEVAAVPEVSLAVVLVEKGGGGTPLNHAPLGREEATLN